MDINLEPVYETVMQAVSAECVFGVVDIVLPPEDMKRYLDAEYHKVKMITEPTQWSNPEDRIAAEDADSRLESFYKSAQIRLEEGTYGLSTLSESVKSRPSFSTEKRKYYIGNKLNIGNSTIYEGHCEISDGLSGLVLIKLVDDVADNPGAMREKRVLDLLHKKPAPQWKHLPLLLDMFKSGGRIGLVLRKFNGYTLNEIMNMQRYRNGIDRKHVVWMLNRILSAIGYAHNTGVIHGNIDPSHLLIKPDDHNVCLVDWSTAAVRPQQTGDKLELSSEFSAPELANEKYIPSSSADIYSIGKIAIWALGGNVSNDTMPDSVEEDLQRFIKGFVTRSQIQRPQNAWQLHKQLIYTIEKLWGRRKFLKFHIDHN